MTLLSPLYVRLIPAEEWGSGEFPRATRTTRLEE